MGSFKKYCFAVISLLFMVLTLQSCSYGYWHDLYSSVLGKNNEIVSKEFTLSIETSPDTICSEDRYYVTFKLKNNSDKNYFFREVPNFYKWEPMKNQFYLNVTYYGETCIPDAMMFDKKKYEYNKILRSQEILKYTKSFTTPRYIYNPARMEFVSEDEKFYDNRNYGEYEIQGVYVTEFNDTIRSEVRKIWYLEK